MRCSLLWILAVIAAIGVGVLAVCLPILLETGSFSIPRKWHALSLPGLSLLAAGELLLGLCFSRLPFLWGLQPLFLCAAAIVPILVAHGIIVAEDVHFDPTSHNLWPFEFVILGGMSSVAAAFGAYAGRGLAWVVKRKGSGNADR